MRREAARFRSSVHRRAESNLLWPDAGTQLDQWPNEFMTEDGRYLICSTHGAIFEQQTGICVEGPCPGAALDRLTIEMDAGSLVVRWPS